MPRRSVVFVFEVCTYMYAHEHALLGEVLDLVQDRGKPADVAPLHLARELVVGGDLLDEHLCV